MKVTRTPIIYTLELKEQEAAILYSLISALSISDIRGYLEIYSPNLARKEKEIVGFQDFLYDLLTLAGCRTEKESRE